MRIPTPQTRVLWRYSGGDPRVGPVTRANPGCTPRTPRPWATYRRVHIQILHLLLEPVHHGRDLLQVHGAQRPVQGLGHLCHVLGHLAQEKVRRRQS